MKKEGDGRKKDIYISDIRGSLSSSCPSILPRVLCMFLFLLASILLIGWVISPSYGHFPTHWIVSGSSKRQIEQKRERERESMRAISIIFMPTYLSIYLAIEAVIKERRMIRQNGRKKYFYRLRRPNDLPYQARGQMGYFSRWKFNAPICAIINQPRVVPIRWFFAVWGALLYLQPELLGPPLDIYGAARHLSNGGATLRSQAPL